MTALLQGPLSAFFQEVPATVTPLVLNTWFAVLAPGIIPPPPVELIYRAVPPPSVQAVQGMYAGRVGDAFAVGVRVYSPANLTFELRGGSYRVKDARTGVQVQTGDARIGTWGQAGDSSEANLLFYDVAGLPAGIYDVTFDVISDASLVQSRPVRLVLRPNPPSP